MQPGIDTHPPTETKATGFDVCQDCLNYPWPYEVWSLQATKERPLPLINRPQTLLAGVAEPSENASRLIADALLDDGFPLELGVVATDREQTVHPPTFLLYSTNLHLIHEDRGSNLINVTGELK